MTMAVETPPSGVIEAWAGDNPFCLVIKPDVGSAVLIDLDKKGWLEEFSDLMRVTGQWILARKEGSQPILMLTVSEGEQPYYTARHYTAFLPPPDAVGAIDMQTLKEQASVKIYGIGKKRVDGQVDRLWILPNGAICPGEDDGIIADQLAKIRLATVLAVAQQ